MEKNYKVAFYTLLGFVIGAILVASVFIISNGSKKEDNNSNKDENVIYGETNTKYEEDIPKVEETTKEEISNEPVVTETSNVVTSQTPNIEVEIIEDELSNEDKVVIQYLEEKYEEINNKTTKEKAKDIFTTTVDFLFYDGQIKGKTLKGLTDKGKEQATKLITKIEVSIENKFPGLIDETKDIYKDKKEKIIEKYYETVEKICKDRQDKCDNLKQDYEDLKQEYKDTFKFLLDLGEKGLDKTKETLTNWYNNFKNN